MSEDILARLFETISSRKGADPDTSYTAKLLAGGSKKIGKKIGEEAAEVVIAALSEGPEALTRESADLLYHLLALWAANGITPDDVYAELARREGTSGIAEKAGRQKS